MLTFFRINCTVVELKLCIDMFLLPACIVLIVPLWN